MRKFIYIGIVLFYTEFMFCQNIEWIDTIAYSEQTLVNICFADNQSVYVLGGKGISLGGGNQGGCYCAAFLHKYSSNGQLLWSTFVSEGEYGAAGPTGVTSDNDGNAYVALWSSAGNYTFQIGDNNYQAGINGYLVKYNPAGQLQWVQILPQTYVNDISINSQQANSDWVQ